MVLCPFSQRKGAPCDAESRGCARAQWGGVWAARATAGDCSLWVCPEGHRACLLHQASLLLKAGTQVGGGHMAMRVSQLSARLVWGTAGALLPPRSGVHSPVQAFPPKPCLRCLQAASPTTERFRQQAAAPVSPARPPRRWASSAPAPRLKRRRQRPKVGEGLALPAASSLINLHPLLLHPRVPFAPLSASLPYRPVHLMRLCLRSRRLCCICAASAAPCCCIPTTTGAFPSYICCIPECAPAVSGAAHGALPIVSAMSHWYIPTMAATFPVLLCWMCLIPQCVLLYIPTAS